MRSYGLGGIDAKIYNKYLKNINNGFYIECGANDGVEQSNTKMLEDVGWTGLLVEPNPHTFAQCVHNRSSKNIFERYALVDTNHNEDFITGFFNFTTHGEGLCGHVPQDNLIDRVWKDEHLIDVPCIQLSKLLDKHNITHIDFFSLDVELYEIQVLDGMDLNRHRPTFILVEVTGPDNKTILERKHQIDELFKSYSYNFIEQISGNDHLYGLGE
jgi:FkbM family methyltransferase